MSGHAAAATDGEMTDHQWSQPEWQSGDWNQWGQASWPSEQQNGVAAHGVSSLDPLQIHDPWASNSNQQQPQVSAETWMATTGTAETNAGSTTPLPVPTTSQVSASTPLPNPTTSQVSASTSLPNPTASQVLASTSLSAPTAAGGVDAGMGPSQESQWWNPPSGTQDWNEQSWQWSNYDWRSYGWHGQGSWSTSGWHEAGSWNSYKGDFSDPPAWPGWSHRKHWVTAIQRWNKGTDLPVQKRAEKVLRCLGWELQQDFEHLPESVLLSSAYLEVIVEIINNKAGVREDDERRRAFKAAIVEGQRRKDETLSQYSLRRLRDFSQASSYGVVIPGEFKAVMLKEGAALSEQNQQNLVSMLGDKDHDPEAVARALSRLDIRGDRMSGFASSTPGDFQESFLAADEADEVEDDEEEALSEDEIYQELEPLDLTEDQVTQVYAVLDQQRGGKPRKRTWKQNKEFKAALKKERTSFVKGQDSRPQFRHGGQRSKMNKEQLKRISRCGLCLKKGHWAEDCPMNPANKKSSLTAFSYCGSSTASGSNGFSSSSWLSSSTLKAWSFLTTPSGEAIVDIGATQDLIGIEALGEFEKILAKIGLKPIKVDAPLTIPSGIGGQAKAIGVVLLPISPGGCAGVLEVTVLAEPIPPLLSVGFLDFLLSTISLPENTIHFDKLKCTLPLKRLATGHRSINLFQWQNGESFPVPDELKTKYQLNDQAFDAMSPSA